MLHAPHTKFHVVSTVLESGYDGNLAKGQLAVVKNKALKGKGKEVTADFDGMTQKDLIAFEIGEVTTPNKQRTVEVPYISTGFFPIGNIVDIKAYAPSNVTLKLDHIEIGYDGINESTALFIPEGKAAVMDIVVEGLVASMFFGQESFIIQKRVYRAVGESMQAVTRRLVKELNEEVIPTATGWASTTDVLSQFLEIGVIDSTTTTTVGVNSVFSSLTLVNNGDSNALADVQAQYPNYTVVQTARDGDNTTYTIVRPQADPALASYVKTVVDVDGKGCADCLATYSLVDGGYVYHVSIEDDGVDLTTALAGLVTGETQLDKLGNKDGRGTYAIVMPAIMAQVAIDAIITARPEAEVKYLGEIKDVCSKTTTTTTAWVAGETCVATTKGFSIIVKDNDCGATRLPELQAAYPDLVITEDGVVGGCKRKYNTTVPTNIVCPECSPIFLQPFYGEAPDNFEGISWEAVAETYDADALMGITIKGKPFFMYPEIYEEDFVPFIETSLKVKSASFGWREDDILNYTGSQYDVDLEFAKVVFVERAQDVNNLSQSHFGAEDEGKMFGTNKWKHKANLFARTNLSEERILKYHKRLLKYVVEFRDQGLSQGSASRSDITHGFGIMVEEGKHDAIQTILSKLAAKVGLEAPIVSVV